MCSRVLRTAASSVQDCGAFIDRTAALVGADTGLLAGLTFATKDLYDVKGFVTAFGNPTWKETHGKAEYTAPPVQMLLDAGASMTGKTHMDELAYSLNGENVHYGTPTNPAAPGRIPGGSSSGSAVAVASGEVDFSLGSDTAGSVRVPASYCGIFGFRPTHGRISLEHARPLAPSYDTCGWFASSATTLQLIGQVLLHSKSEPHKKLKRLLWAKDGFENARKETTQSIQDAIDSAVTPIKTLLQKSENVTVASLEGEGDLSQWVKTFRTLQGAEVWRCHGDWIQRVKPNFGPGIKERFELASKITPEDVAKAAISQEKIRKHLDDLLGSDGVLFLPTVPGPAPVCNVATDKLDAFRGEVLCLACIASIGGLPQVNVPIAKVGNYPIGLGLIGPRDSDMALLELTKSLMEIFQ